MHGRARQITAAWWEHSRHVHSSCVSRRADAAAVANVQKLIIDKTEKAAAMAACVVRAVRCTSDTISAVV
jgi:hypothetical protein